MLENEWVGQRFIYSVFLRLYLYGTSSNGMDIILLIISLILLAVSSLLIAVLLTPGNRDGIS